MHVIDIVLILFGMFTLYGVATKPDFYWNSRRIARTRQMIGDERTSTMYIVVGILMLGVGVWGIFFAV
ncbi:MAG: hypothetical protein GY943_12970 [Chloroflexi bacterium]|nr:hypothetical protein [Chloroflexota bacterium]